MEEGFAKALCEYSDHEQEPSVKKYVYLAKHFQ